MTEISRPPDLWLDPIPEVFRADAREAINAGDAEFLSYASNMDSFHLVFYNQDHLIARGIFEAALLYAVTMPRVNNHHVPPWALACLFRRADRNRLRAAGDPLPGPGPFTLYRGVAGRGAARRVRGYSWTASFEKAKWFAQRLASILADPTVFRVEAPESWVLAYDNGGNEQEFLLDLPHKAKAVRMWPD